MPELPEVESVRKNLAQVLLDKKIVDVKRLREKSFPDFEEKKSFLIGQSFTDCRRRAKILDLVLANQQHLLIHLKMTGQLIFLDSDGQRLGGGHPTADWVNDLPSKHTRVIFDLKDDQGQKSQLFFNDMRVFGWLKLKDEAELASEFKNYGPDINDPSLKVDYLLEKASRRSIPIKQFIMGNQVISGVGNIYASEALFRARISPLRTVKSLNREEMQRLLTKMQEIIAEAIELGGTTFDGHYVGVDGFAGGFQDKLQVYGQEGCDCPVCGGEILRIKQGGRSTFYCPNCQQ
jgi:formamidopyrimidine-DNA glycosylase